MVVIFKACRINRGTRKLIRTSILKKKKKKHYLEHSKLLHAAGFNEIVREARKDIPLEISIGFYAVHVC
jgi:hypothetical protein